MQDQRPVFYVRGVLAADGIHRYVCGVLAANCIQAMLRCMKSIHCICTACPQNFHKLSTYHEAQCGVNSALHIGDSDGPGPCL